MLLSTAFDLHILDQILESGTEAVQFVNGTLSVGPATQQAFVERLYHGVLDRNPDAQGISFWNNTLSKGALNDQQVAQYFLTSPEYMSENPAIDPTHFINDTYQHFLDRGPSTTELAQATAALNTGTSAADLVVNIANSPEAQTEMSADTQHVWVANSSAQLIQFIYDTALGREADVAGLVFWTEKLDSGVAVETVIQSILQSPEYTADHEGQSNTALVNTLYTNALGRDATATDLAQVSQQFQNGTLTPTGLVASLTQSNEAYAHLVTTL